MSNIETRTKLAFHIVTAGVVGGLGLMVVESSVAATLVDKTSLKHISRTI